MRWTERDLLAKLLLGLVNLGQALRHQIEADPQPEPMIGEQRLLLRPSTASACAR